MPSHCPTSLLGPFHGAIAVPSVTRCRCRRGHRCAGGARQYRWRHLLNGRETARSGEWAQHFSSELITHYTFHPESDVLPTQIFWPDLALLLIFRSSIFTARQLYAKRGICRRRVSVRPSVCVCVFVCVCVCVCDILLNAPLDSVLPSI